MSSKRTCSTRLLLGGAIAGLLVAALYFIRRRTDRQIIQRRFWDPLYDWGAPLYDAVDWLTGGTTHRLRLRALEYLPPPGSRVLEVGIGSGHLHCDLAARYELAGLDLALGMVALTQRRLAARGLRSDLCQGSVEALPWPAQTFDAVLSTFAFSAFSDADCALAEMRRVLKPGGRLIIVDAGVSQDGNAFSRALAWLWEFLGDYMRDEVPLLHAHGFTDVQREDYGPGSCVHVTVGSRPLSK